ncbi:MULTISPECIES: ABC transporter permease [Nocardiaceae]|uniref:ABC-2 type transport system permease protein n=1 Tax=Rhodococcoides corynebacterioides TaxID=53972 RepID=A0ABS2KXK9_9NOCA|nr:MULTISPECIES: ABC transporter permease [Rhodococcus]MBM7416041.1 ABC-2 type transport system permease protein [Rhodococcus corynebacterioides]MBP1114294.1 ABC-2 type transport system permease protein [Rhodococcus sp. PvP016]
MTATRDAGRVSHRAPEPTAFKQWASLSGRSLGSMARSGSLVVAVVAPAVYTVGFYLPLRLVMQFQGLDYAQFLMPIICLQAMAFTAISAAQRAAIEGQSGMTTRLQTMPVTPWVPLLSRATANLVHASLSLIAALVYGSLIGFRFQAGLDDAVIFMLFALLVGAALTTGGDAIGSLSRSPEATSQALTLPQLILGMLSSGFVPETGFPEWIRPFVRNQPISLFSKAMRDMAEGGVNSATLWPAIAWAVGLIVVLVPLAVWASTRRS